MLCAAPVLASRSHHAWPVSQPRGSGNRNDIALHEANRYADTHQPLQNIKMSCYVFFFREMMKRYGPEEVSQLCNPTAGCRIPGFQGPRMPFRIEARHKTAHCSQTRRLKPSSHCCWEFNNIELVPAAVQMPSQQSRFAHQKKDLRSNVPEEGIQANHNYL